MRKVVALLVCLASYACTNGQNASFGTNPVLPGFNPDPSVIRVDDTYYMATSTFEWFPGVPIYESKDLADWKLIGHALTRKSQLDMRGIMDADGIYAPMLKYHDGIYYLLYTIVESSKRWANSRYANYVVTATSPGGPWSEPTFIDALGFDPSLFIDDDGKAYVLCRMFDHRDGYHPSPGIGIHEVDLLTFSPKELPKIIYLDKAQTNEGPHIYKKDGYYYLFTAEGGTWYEHQEQVSRSMQIYGPYTPAPEVLVTSKDDPNNELQRAGHASLVETPKGEWYIAYLTSRRVDERDLSPLGRESSISKIEWNKEGWPVLAKGGHNPSSTFELPKPFKTTTQNRYKSFNDDFDNETLDIGYQYLREPAEKSWVNTTEKPGYLMLRGRAPISRENDQSLIARRVTSLYGEASTKLLFEPQSFKHHAGLTVYYNTSAFYYLSMTYEQGKGNCLKIIANRSDQYEEPLKDNYIVLGDQTEVQLKVLFNGADLQFQFATEDDQWINIGPVLDFGELSDEKVKSYTGAMVGLAAQDHMYENVKAYFDYFNYSPKAKVTP